MKETRKIESPESRRIQILAAADLVLLEVGIDRFTVDQVIKKAGIAKGTVYSYYRNKDEMLAEIGGKALNLLQKTFKDAVEKEESYINKIKAISHSHYDYTRRYPAYSELIYYIERLEFNILLKEYTKISQSITDFVVNIIKEGQQTCEIKENLDARMLNYIIWATSVGAVQFIKTKENMLKNHHEISTDKMMKIYTETIAEGIRN